MKYAGV